MKIKKEYIVLLSLIVVLSAYLILRSQNETHYQLPTLPVIKKGDFTKIEIKTPKEKIVLEKKNNAWRLLPHEYPVEKNLINKIVDTLHQLTLTALVSESKDYRRYNLDKDKRIEVKAWSNGELVRHFLIGKTASSYRHTFVKLADDDRVYHARGNFRSAFDQTTQSLRDKSVLSFGVSEIKAITITENGHTFTLKRQKPEQATAKKADSKKPAKGEAAKKAKTVPGPIWILADGRKVDQGKVKDMVAVLSALRCDSYIEGKEKKDFTKPICTVVLQGRKQYRLDIFAKTSKDSGTYPAVSSLHEYPFLLPEWRVKSIMKKEDELVIKKAVKEAKPVAKGAAAQ